MTLWNIKLVVSSFLDMILIFYYFTKLITLKIVVLKKHLLHVVLFMIPRN